ncbi:uncharacterized protein CcaverHIS019_0601770 [Cutaneotrichosporon cavernicola]|uniref:rRNA-processing protein FYV7 n=1 Tax=Cutaneotrichosporon cavernicola TaxID=279322 RepID=A0AA48L8A4_9TREE|nr:uncharacterized protein CcaverHIS019_0601770 [Cutaneotrichosporon cavernicola]BEI93718.1 hypothetical protein CcaverHIS019_0601770 [Cutaneotrichosporon cavernicola]
MPRVTKAQKEARGVSGKPKGKGKPATGFKVGPSHAPRNAYLGKAQKKKAELIAAAKVKQQYAKVLAREGMQSVRVGGKGGAARLEKRMAAAMVDADLDEGSDSDSDSGSDAEDEAARAAARMRQAAREADEARAERRERKAFERGQTGTEKAFRPGRRPKPKQHDKSQKRTVRALSPPKVEPREGRLRDLKREAFGQRHSGRAGGQPRMGARMDMLLEKIRRSK